MPSASAPGPFGARPFRVANERTSLDAGCSARGPAPHSQAEVLAELDHGGIRERDGARGAGRSSRSVVGSAGAGPENDPEKRSRPTASRHCRRCPWQTGRLSRNLRWPSISRFSRPSRMCRPEPLVRYGLSRELSQIYASSISPQPWPSLLCPDAILRSRQ